MIRTVGECGTFTNDDFSATACSSVDAELGVDLVVPRHLIPRIVIASPLRSEATSNVAFNPVYWDGLYRTKADKQSKCCPITQPSMDPTYLCVKRTCGGIWIGPDWRPNHLTAAHVLGLLSVVHKQLIRHSPLSIHACANHAQSVAIRRYYGPRRDHWFAVLLPNTFSPALTEATCGDGVGD
jgi:hypothetical protein